MLDDLLYAAGRTLSLDKLLIAMPQQICQAFRLDCFYLFLRRGADFVLQQPEPRVESVSLRASSAILVQLRRDRNLLSLDEGDGDAWLVLAREQELNALRGLGAHWLLALPGRTGLTGFAALGRMSQEPFTRREGRLLRDLASRIGVGLETVEFQQTLQEQAAERERTARRLELARTVQERMLPQTLPTAARLSAAAMYQSMEEVGGDYYDAFWTPGNLICYVIADVSGKGVASALLMSTLRATVRTAMLTAPGLPQLLHLLNEQLLEASAPSSYATLAILLYDPISHTLTSSNAGHNPPLLLSGETVRRLGCGGPVLGLLADTAYEEEKISLAAGDVVLLYTDGLVERTSPEGEEWGEARLIRAAQAEVEHQKSEGIVQRIVDAVTAFARDTVPPDDTTLLVLRSEADTVN